MSKRKHDNDPAGRNVKKRIDNIQNVQILPAVDESQTVPIAFKYEEVTVNPTSSRRSFSIFESHHISAGPCCQVCQEEEESKTSCPSRRTSTR